MANNTKLYSVINALQAVDASLWSKLSTVNDALTGYLSASAVSNKFTAIENEISTLKNTGADNALTGLVAKTGITLSKKANHSYDVSVTGYDAITGALAGYNSSATVANAISTAETNAKGYTDTVSAALKTAWEADDSTTLTSAKTYANTLSAAVSGAAKNYADGLNTAMDERVDKIEDSLSGWTVGTTDIKSTINSDISTATSTLSTNLVNGSTYKTFKAVEDQINAIDTFISGDAGLQSQVTANTNKLSGVTSVVDYVAGKISDLSLDSALTGVTDPQDVITLGVDGHVVTGKFLYNEDQFKVDSHKLGLDIQLSAVTAPSGLATEFTLVNNKGVQIGNKISIATESILQSATYSKAASAGDGYAVGDDILTLVFKTGTGTTTNVVNIKDLINKDELDAQVTSKVTELSTAVFVGNTSLSSEFRADIDYISGQVGTLSNLTTTAQGSIVAAVNELDAQISGALDANKVIVGAADGIKASTYVIGLSGVSSGTVDTFGADGKLATEKAVKEFVELGLDDLLEKINNLNTSINKA